jgi:hypothetical protein
MGKEGEIHAMLFSSLITQPINLAKARSQLWKLFSSFNLGSKRAQQWTVASSAIKRETTRAT